jgi:hypothetical protein
MMRRKATAAAEVGAASLAGTAVITGVAKATGGCRGNRGAGRAQRPMGWIPDEELESA